ncbi:MAG TPA: ABC transporter permease [Pontiellaceae bacterium]|nr:ABC transporter permease [Pontiellaceae bacterium]HPR83814.1 ABC transporter permease [Pontiellaceae bacterium]
MKQSFSLFLAFKYLKPKRSFLSVVTLLSLLGVTLGVAVLIIVLSVMTGFDETWRERILSFNAHVKVSEYGGVVRQPDKVLSALKKVKGVTGAAPNLEGLVFVQVGGNAQPAQLRGIDPELEKTVSQVPNHMVEGQFSVGRGQIVVGRDLALHCGLRMGDKLLVYSPQNFVSKDEFRLPEELTVSGIFEVGMYEIDSGYVLTSLQTARSIYNVEQGVHSVQVMTADPMQAPVIARDIHKALGPFFDARTWIDLNRQLFTALQTEKNMMFFLLIFITIVAAFGITNTLITLTVQKTHEIGLLKAIGFSNRRIVAIFLWIGMVQGVIGTGMGLGLGLLALKYRNELLNFISSQFRVDLLPKELYQLSQIPSHTTAQDVVTVCATVLVICTLAGLVPAWRAARLEPVEALRNE